ncbi:GlsB/YeaQ/YmgE family stress response membrane protein [Amycolatopsis benzoatilytica]|uniref:GlsB/YeaQ/YmgE family stress response membrane protein n=1 Tax=Amycolatopsis benzoatilytica TaxID=346045 RepID=UPI0003655DD3|nr:GlsB/YeaQ/YmgE family stress response membrane protein [Amycolatopsis benzoatilytica]
MGVVSWIILGLIAGVIAKILMPGKDPGGCIITILLGIGGAFVGGWIGKTLFHTQLGTFFEARTWGLAILGALVILVVYRLVLGNRKHHRRD